MKRYPIVHVEFSVADREASAEFYQQLFQWQFAHHPDQDYSTFDTGAISGGLNSIDDALAQAGDVLIYVGSQDVDADLERAEWLGGTVIVPRTAIPGVGWYGVFADPAGNHIALLNVAA